MGKQPSLVSEEAEPSWIIQSGRSTSYNYIRYEVNLLVLYIILSWKPFLKRNGKMSSAKPSASENMYFPRPT